MTNFDEEMMKRALREAADDFAVSDEAFERILDEARESAATDELPRIRAFIRRNGAGRTSAFAVAACLVLLAVAVPLFNSEARTKEFNAVPDIHSPAAQSGTKSLSFGSPGLAITGTSVSGTGFEDGATPSATGSTASQGGVKLSVTSGVDVSQQSSLRVEEIGTIRLTVGATRFQSTLSELADFATTDGGFVASTQSHMGTKATHTYSTGTIVLQVPERKFTMLVDQVRHAGVATSVVTSANDVTGQYVDLQARISALQVSRSQYLKIMTRTTSIGGILSVQKQLDNIQSQIEQLQAQLNLLNTETTYATLTVSLSEAGHPVIAPIQSRTGVNKAWHDSLHGFAAGVEWSIRIAGPLLFALLLLAALLLIGRWTWRATERRRGGIS